MANHGANPANVERVANPIYSTTAHFKRIAAEELRCGVRTFPHLVDDPDVDFEPNDTVAYEREALPIVVVGQDELLCDLSELISDDDVDDCANAAQPIDYRQFEQNVAALAVAIPAPLLAEPAAFQAGPIMERTSEGWHAGTNMVQTSDRGKAGVGPDHSFEDRSESAKDQWSNAQNATSEPAETAVSSVAAASFAESQRGEVITLFGCRGGAGSTTLAINLAGQLAATGQPTLLIDMDLQLGDVMVSLDMQSHDQISFAAAVREFASLEGSVFVRRLVQHRSGFYVLSQNDKLEELDGGLSSQVAVFLRYLRRWFRWIVIDGVRDFSEMPLAILDSSDTISLIVTQDVAAVRRAQRVASVFTKLGISPARVSLVLNRYARFSKIKVAEVERALAMPVASLVRNDYSTTSKSLNAGSLLLAAARRKGVTRDIRRMADQTQRRLGELS